MDESPRRCRTPAPRPETPTPQPGAVERARMNFRQSRHETLNNLQDSPRRRHPCNTENASHTLSPPEREASARSVFLGNRVRIINFFCAIELSYYRLFRPPCSSSESHTITKPSFNANGCWHQSSNYLPMLPQSKRCVGQQRRQQQAHLQHQALPANQSICYSVL